MRGKWASVALAGVVGVSAVGVGGGAAAAWMDRSEMRQMAPGVDRAAPDPAAAVGQLGALGSVLETANGLVGLASADKPDAAALNDKLNALGVASKTLQDLVGGAGLPSVAASPAVPASPLPSVPVTGVLPNAPGSAAHKALPLPTVSLEDALANLKKHAAELVAAATKAPPDADGVKSAVTAIATDVLGVATATVTKLTGV